MNNYSSIIMEYPYVPSKFVSWEEIERWAEIVVEKIGNRKFDSIIAVIRGGLVPARIIADYLNIKDVFTLKTEHWGVTASPDMKARITHPVVIDLTGKDVLIVDDITDTGDSLSLAIEATKKKSPKSLATATLLHITRSKIQPDYYAEEITAQNWKWFIFPWNRKEDLRNLILGCLNSESTEEDAVTCMVKKHDLYVTKREFHETLEWLAKTRKITFEDGIIKKVQ